MTRAFRQMARYVAYTVAGPTQALLAGHETLAEGRD